MLLVSPHMKIRCLLPLLGLLVIADSIPAQTYTRSEAFSEPPKNWLPSRANPLFGFVTPSPIGPNGAAGGIFQPTTFFNYYGDLFLNGTLGRDQTLTASGEVLINNTSGTPPYVTTVYVGHFAQSASPFVQVLGFAISGAEGNSVTVCAIIQFADGAAFVGKPISVSVNPNRVLNWSYDWNPTGGPKGVGQLSVRVGTRRAFVNLDKTSDGSDFALDSFGLFQPAFTLPDSRSFLEFFVDDLSYTAFVGRPPTLRIRGPKVLQTNDRSITIRGTSKVARGNEITRVRYQLVRDGRTSRFRTAKGTRQWKFTANVPRGASSVKITARSDDGATTTKRQKIRRN